MKQEIEEGKRDEERGTRKERKENKGGHSVGEDVGVGEKGAVIIIQRLRALSSALSLALALKEELRNLKPETGGKKCHRRPISSLIKKKAINRDEKKKWK